MRALGACAGCAITRTDRPKPTLVCMVVVRAAVVARPVVASGDGRWLAEAVLPLAPGMPVKEPPEKEPSDGMGIARMPSKGVRATVPRDTGGGPMPKARALTGGANIRWRGACNERAPRLG